MTTMTYHGNEASTPPECVGPMAIPVPVRRALHRLAQATAVDDLVPVSVCACEVVRRLSRPGTPSQARVIQGRLELVTPPSTRRIDATVSFRDAVRRFPGSGVPGVPVDVAILVSQDGSRLYVESLTRSAGAPTAQVWAHSLLRLLSCAGDAPDLPLAVHALPGCDLAHVEHRR